MNGSVLESNLKVVLSSLVENVNKTGYNISKKGSTDSFQLKIAEIDLNYRMASSTVCNCTRNIIQLPTISFMLLLLTSASAQNANLTDPQRSYCGGDAIRNGSALERNLKMVLSSLVENVNKTGYNISSYGENGDKMYGLAQCRGDLNASTCQACVSDVREALIEDCTSGSINDPMQACFLRYDTHNFYSQLDSSGEVDSAVSCVNTKINDTGADVRSLDWNTTSLLTTVKQNAVSSNVGYSTFNENGIYSLAQCWRDLNKSLCNQCLNIVYTNLSFCPSGTIEGEANTENCMLRFGRDKFYGDGVPLLSPTTGSGPSVTPSSGPSSRSGSGPSVTPSSGPSSRSESGPSETPSSGSSMLTKAKNRHDLPLVLGLTIASVIIVVLLVGVVLICKRKYNKQWLPGYYKPSNEYSIAISKSKLNYKFQTLQIATKKFNLTNKIGQGGFGSVYKGVLLDDREIAVKRLFSNIEQSVSDFFNEVNLISRIQHKNLVNLLGFSVDGPYKLLVYEYLPNKSLDRFLFEESMGNLLDWQRRFDIILGTASGLAYLHQESHIRIIHRDIKASNILLDQCFKPKIADFGLVRHFSEDQTHLSTTIVGTRGYMAPEYLVHGHLTEKVDVYAFGVLVLEIISGRKNITAMHANDTPSLLTMIWNHYLSGAISNIIDPNIEENYQDEVLQVVQVALLCTQASATLRPSMSKVIMFLTNKDLNLPTTTQPPFIDVNNFESNTNVDVMSKSQSNSNPYVVPTSKMYNPTLNIASSPTTPMSLNTISTSSYGPR